MRKRTGLTFTRFCGAAGATPAWRTQRGIQLRPLMSAVCASNAFPGVFMPAEHEGRELMDGGILSSVPLDLLRPLTSARIVAVDTRPSPTAPLALPEEYASVWRRLRGPARGGVPVVARLLEKAHTIPQSRLIERTDTLHPPYLTISPEFGTTSTSRTSASSTRRMRSAGGRRGWRLTTSPNSSKEQLREWGVPFVGAGGALRSTAYSERLSPLQPPRPVRPSSLSTESPCTFGLSRTLGSSTGR